MPLRVFKIYMLECTAIGHKGSLEELAQFWVLVKKRCKDIYDYKNYIVACGNVMKLMTGYKKSRQS